MSDFNITAELAGKLWEHGQQPDGNVVLRKGVVTAVVADFTSCSVSIAGGLAMPGIRTFTAVRTGDEVYVAELGNVRIVVAHVDTGWHEIGDPGEPAFQNFWTNIGGVRAPARYRKIAGIVFVEGSITAGNSSATVFTLPVGYRPMFELRLPAVALDGGTRRAGIWYIQPNGNCGLFLEGSGATNPIDEANCEFSFVAEQ